jgi:uncharacterized protein (TIGR02466 family)
VSNIIYPFQTPIYQSYIDSISFTQIKKDVNLFIDNNFNLFNNRLGWDCPTLTTQGISVEQNIKSNKLVEEIQNHVQNFWNIWEFSITKKLYIEQLWVNISKKGDYQEVHDHGDCLFSGTVYINVDEHSGDFVLQNPLYVENILMKDSNIIPKSYFITPENSMIILFPSWMQHRVSQNQSSINRISISFNIKANFN